MTEQLAFAATNSTVQISNCVVTCSVYVYELVINARVTSVCLMNEIIIHWTIVNVASICIIPQVGYLTTLSVSNVYRRVIG
jgi:hypothetical protein